MKIETTEHGDIVLKEVFGELILETASGEKLIVCMRDSGFEFSYGGKCYSAQEGQVNDRSKSRNSKISIAEAQLEITRLGYEWEAMGTISGTGTIALKVRQVSKKWVHAVFHTYSLNSIDVWHEMLMWARSQKEASLGKSFTLIKAEIAGLGFATKVIKEPYSIVVLDNYSRNLSTHNVFPIASNHEMSINSAWESALKWAKSIAEKRKTPQWKENREVDMLRNELDKLGFYSLEVFDNAEYSGRGVVTALITSKTNSAVSQERDIHPSLNARSIQWTKLVSWAKHNSQV